jgi:pyruvyltransferase
MIMQSSLNIRKPTDVTLQRQKNGKTNPRNVFWSWYEPRNFGDWIGPFLFEAMTGKRPLFCPFRPKFPDQTTYMIVGSILRKIKAERQAIVWGAGIISREDVFLAPRRIHAVRGPHTRARCLELGFECPEIYGDPAILLPEFLPVPAQDMVPEHLAIVPHHKEFGRAAALYKDTPGVHVVDVTRSVQDVTRDIARCGAVASSSLHGLIIAHAYKRPACWIEFADPVHGDRIKFSDYCLGVGLADPGLPLRVETVVNPERLISMAHAAPAPYLEETTRELRAACPFPMP